MFPGRGTSPSDKLYELTIALALLPAATNLRLDTGWGGTPNPDIPGAWLEEPSETLPPRYHRDSQYVLDYEPDNPKPYDAALTSR